MKRIHSNGSLINHNLRQILELDGGVNVYDRLSIMKILNSIEIEILNKKIFNNLCIILSLIIAIIILEVYFVKLDERYITLTIICSFSLILVLAIGFTLNYKSYRDNYKLTRLKRNKLNSVSIYDIRECLDGVNPLNNIHKNLLIKLLSYKNLKGDNITMYITIDFSSDRQYKKYKKRIKEEFDLERYINKQQLENSML